MPTPPSAIFDISPLISERTAVFPGDTPFRARNLLSFDTGDHLKLSSIETTVHLGAHADATNHYHASGAGIEARELHRYLGCAQVIEVACAPGTRVQISDLRIDVSARRLLIRTNSFPNTDQWTDDFVSLSPELIHHLHSLGVLLVGIDTPSVDPATSKTLESHQALWQTQIAVLEGLILGGVPAGTYLLSALPLRLKGADASPVRAVLLPPNYDFT